MDHSPSGDPVEKSPLPTSEGEIISINTSPEAASSSNGVSDEQVEFKALEILPIIHDIFCCVARDPLDNASKQRESAECCQRILDLQKRFDIARAHINQLTGIDFNQEEQLNQLKQLAEQLKKYLALLSSYKVLKL